MNNLMIFENKEVEVFELNGQVLFNPKHVAGCLDIKNVNDNLRGMNSKQVIKLTNLDIGNPDFRKLNNRGENFLTESGVYQIIFKSKKKEAEKFQDWVTDEVLPQIRRTGGYVKEEKEEEFIKNYFPSFSEEVKQAMVLDLKHQNEKIQKELEEKNKFIHQISISDNSLKVEDVAQIASKDGIKIGRNKLWTKLREWGLIKSTDKYAPFQKYIDSGYFEVVEGAKETYKGVFTYKTTKVTGKGQVYIIDRLIKEAN